MKDKIEKVILKLVAKEVYSTAEKEANSACMFFAYQPRIPKQLKNKRVDEKKYHN